MSDTLTTKQLDEIVLAAVKRAGGVDTSEIANTVRIKVYPFSEERRLAAVQRSLQRLRRTGAVIYRPAWHFNDLQ